MTSITTRAGKGSPLTHNEVDANFTNLNNDKLDTAGIALGSAASPTLKFTGDPNTGIYSPGADQLAVATNGTGRLFVNSTGLVGIGTTSPTSLIHGKGTSAADVTYRLEPTSNSYKSTLYISSTGSGDGGIQYDSNSNDLRMFSYGTLSFNVGAANISGAIGNERLRIDSSGRVGIGTSSPNTTLHVYGGDGKIQKGVSVTDISELTFSNAYRTGRILSSYTNPAYFTETYIAFHTNRTGEANDTVGEAMRIAGGNVGIGTTSPTTLLDVNADTVRVRTARTPASASATGATGEICWDANYIYVCTATNTWRRSAISSW
jgi:hypothetical protein